MIVEIPLAVKTDIEDVAVLEEALKEMLADWDFSVGRPIRVE